MTSTLDAELARDWVRRWDAQQEFYIADREERFAVIADVVAHALSGGTTSGAGTGSGGGTGQGAGTSGTDAAGGAGSGGGTDPGGTVLDLGCGPGSLSARLAERLPGARIIGLDSDPLLLALARARYCAGMEFVAADLTEPGWTRQVPAVVDAAVSTTALHWLAPADLAALYRELGRRLRPGGVFVNGDHVRAGDPVLDELAALVRRGRAERAGVTGNEDWAQWWAAVEADPALAGLVAERAQPTAANHDGNALTLAEQTQLLRAAGFQSVGTVWQSGDDRVLVAIR